MRYQPLSVALLLMFFVHHYAFAVTDEVSEKLINLGILNGQVQGGNMVKTNRTISDPVIYREELRRGGSDVLVIREATAREVSNGDAIITVKNKVPGGQQNAYITIKISMLINGKKVPINFSMCGKDVILSIPPYAKIIELRVDEPVELQVPANYKGNIMLTMQIEDVDDCNK